MNTITENVVCIYKGKELIAILKRDEMTGHKIIHMTSEASIEEITELINPDHTLI